MVDVSEEGFEGTTLLNFMKDVLEQEPKIRQDAIASAKSNVILTLKNKDGKQKSWYFDFTKNGTVEKLEDGKQPKADVTLIMKDSDFLKLVDDKVNPQKLFMSGRLKIKGNLMKAVTIEKVLRAADPRPKL